MDTFAIQFNTVQGVTDDLYKCLASLNGYKESLDSVTDSLSHNMSSGFYTSFERRINKIGMDLADMANASSGLGNALEQIIDKYLQTELKLSPQVSGGIRTPYGTIPEGSDDRIRNAIEAFKEMLRKIFFPYSGSDRAEVIEKILTMLITLGFLTGGKNTAGAEGEYWGRGSGGYVDSGEEEKSRLERLADMFDFPGDIHDSISTIYDVFDKEGFDESGVGGFLTGVLGVLSAGADMADSETTSELYRNGVGFGKSFFGGTKDLLSMLKHADIIPDNKITGGLLFGLKELKNAAGFSEDFLENYEKNNDNFAGFIRDSGKMAEDAAEFVQGAVTSKDGFLKGLKGKELITAEIWKTTFTSLYTAGSYAIGDMIDQAKNGTLSWESGAESWGKGAVGGLGKIHEFLTLGLVDSDMDNTWNIYKKYVERNAKIVREYGNNGFTRTGLLIGGTLDAFVEGSVETIWTTSCDAAEKIVDNVTTAYESVKGAASWVWSKGSDFVSSIW